MTELTANPPNQPTNPLVDLLLSPLVKIIFLAAVTAVVFFIAEHNVLMSIQEGFVEDIEDQESWAAGGNSMRRLAFLSCAAIGVVSLLIGKAKFRLNFPTFMIAAYLFWAGISVVWSIDPGTTVRRYTLALCCAIGCFGFSRIVEIKDIVFAAVLVSLGNLVLGVGAEIILGAFSPLGGEYRFAGTIHPNIQAASLAMGSIAAFTMARVQPKAKVPFYAIFGLLFMFLVLTKCRSATATVPVSLGVIWIASQPTRNIVMGFFVAFWMGSMVSLLCMVSGFDPIAEYSEILLLGRSEETGSSLTGRLPLWQDLALYVSFKPWQGYGFGAFWTPRHIYDIAVSQEWVISEAHNSYVDATLQLGIIGGLLMFLSAISTFFYSAITFRRTHRPEYLFLVGGVFFCIVRGFTESGLSSPGSVTSFLFLSIVAHSWHTPAKLIDDIDGEVNNEPPSLQTSSDSQH